MAYRNSHYLDIGKSHRVLTASFFPQMRWYVRGERRTARAQDRRVLAYEAGQLLNVIAVFVADQDRVDIRHGEPDGGERSLQPPHSNTAVDQQDGFRRSHQDRVPGAAAAETRYCQQSGISG
jgi:hypothetical protein